MFDKSKPSGDDLSHASNMSELLGLSCAPDVQDKPFFFEGVSDKGASVVITSTKVFTGKDTGKDSDTAPLAIGIHNEKILWICDRDKFLNAYSSYISKNTSTCVVYDFGNAYIQPGFHDAHIHFFHSALIDCGLMVRYVGLNEQDCALKAAKLASENPNAKWILTQGWRESSWDIPEVPTRLSLDKVLPDRPCAMYSGDAHTLWVNSCGLRKLGLDDDVEDLPGGKYERDEQGRLTGILRESAAMSAFAKIAFDLGRDQLEDSYKSFAYKLAASGITSVDDVALCASAEDDFVYGDIYASLADFGDIPIRVNMFPVLLAGLNRFFDVLPYERGSRVRVCGVKQFFDGVSSQHTAWLGSPYENPRFSGDCGRPTIDPRVMEDMICEAFDKDIRVRIHSIGDEATKQLLDICERYKASAETKNKYPKLVIEHLENLNQTDLKRFSELDVIASVQPRHMLLDPGGPERDLGIKRSNLAWPLRTLVNEETILAFGTDSPVTNTDPLRVLYAATNRKDPVVDRMDGNSIDNSWHEEECISMHDAICAYTYGSACASGRECEVGRIEEGMLADIVVFDESPFEHLDDSLLDIKIMATFVGGKPVYVNEQ